MVILSIAGSTDRDRFPFAFHGTKKVLLMPSPERLRQTKAAQSYAFNQNDGSICFKFQVLRDSPGSSETSRPSLTRSENAHGNSGTLSVNSGNKRICNDYSTKKRTAQVLFGFREVAGDQRSQHMEKSSETEPLCARICLTALSLFRRRKSLFSGAQSDRRFFRSPADRRLRLQNFPVVRVPADG